MKTDKNVKKPKIKVVNPNYKGATPEDVAKVLLRVDRVVELVYRAESSI